MRHPSRQTKRKLLVVVTGKDIELRETYDELRCSNFGWDEASELAADERGVHGEGAGQRSEWVG